MCYIVNTMNNSVGVRELRRQASAVIKRVTTGESIYITDHGYPVARIVPLNNNRFDQLVVEGKIAEGEGNLIDEMNSLGLPLTIPKARLTPSMALSELRAEER